MSSGKPVDKRLSTHLARFTPGLRNDVTGLSVMRELATTLQARGVVVGTAGRQTEWDNWFARHGIERLAGIRTFPMLGVALEAYENADGHKSGSS